MSLRSSRLSFEDRDPRIALQTEGGARTIPRIFQHRDQVVDALWPDLAPEAAAARLNTAVHYARRALGDPTAIVRRPLQMVPVVEVGSASSSRKCDWHFGQLTSRSIQAW